MTGIIKVDTIQNNGGTTAMTIASNGFVIPPAGGIIQMQYNQLTTPAVSQTITAQTYDVVDNFPTVSITPVSTSSKVKIDAQWFGELGDALQQHNHMFFFYRDTTILRYSGTSHDNTWRGIAPSSITYTESGNNASTPNILYMSYFDEPNTTSAITYKLGFIGNTGMAIYINRCVADNNAGNYERGTSFISATEIAG